MITEEIFSLRKKDLRKAPTSFVAETLRLSNEAKHEMSNFRVLQPIDLDPGYSWMENIWQIWKCRTDLERQQLARAAGEGESKVGKRDGLKRWRRDIEKCGFEMWADEGIV